MTATPPEQPDDRPVVYLWLARPQVGREQLLMVLTDHPEHGVTYRPLLFLDAESAASQRGLAQEAATAMGVQAVLREFRAVAVLDNTGTGE